MTVGIDEGGGPVVTAGELEEEEVAVGSGELAREGKHALGAAHGTGTLDRVSGVAQEVAVRNHEAAVGPGRGRFLIVVEVFTAEEAAHLPVLVELEVKEEVGVQVRLLLGAVGEAVTAAAGGVGITAVRSLALATGVVIVVAAVGDPLEPGGELDGDLQVRTDDGLLLDGLVLPDAPPHAAAGDGSPFVAVAGLCQTAVVALILVTEVLGVVGTVEFAFAHEVGTDVRLGVTRFGVREGYGALHLDGVVQLVAGLEEGAETVEAVVRKGTGGVLLGDRGVDGAALVAAGEGDVGVRVEAVVEGIHEVVLLGLGVDEVAVHPFELLVVVEAGTEGHAETGDVTVDLQQGRDLALVAVGPHVHVVDIPLGGAAEVVTVTGGVTFHKHVLETRTGSHLVDTDGLGHGNAEATGALAALGRDDDGAVQTAGTVQGRSGSALQDGHGLEVVRVQVLQGVTIVQVVGVPVGGRIHNVVVQDDTVYDEDRLVVLAEGGGAADEDLVAAEHTTVGGVDLDTGDLTLQGGNRVDQVRVEVGALEFGHRVTQGFLVTPDTESRNDRSLKHLGILLEDDVEGAAVPGDDLGGIADAGELDRVSHLDIGKDIGTVVRHDRAVLGSLHKHGSADNSVTGRILHRSPHRRLCEGRQACRQKREHEGKSDEQIFHVLWFCWLRIRIDKYYFRL